MPYQVHMEERDQRFLDGIPLTDRAREALRDFITYGLAGVTDEFRLDPANRVGNYFRRDLTLVDEDSQGVKRCNQFDFTVDDTPAYTGWLIVLSVDHDDGAWRGPGRGRPGSLGSTTGRGGWVVPPVT